MLLPTSALIASALPQLCDARVVGGSSGVCAILRSVSGADCRIVEIIRRGVEADQSPRNAHLATRAGSFRCLLEILGGEPFTAAISSVNAAMLRVEPPPDQRMASRVAA